MVWTARSRFAAARTETSGSTKTARRLLRGTYGLGATAPFEVEAMASFEPLSAIFSDSTVRVMNISAHEMRDCRFGSGFSRQSVGRLSPGQHVDAVRQGPRNRAALQL